MTLFKSAALAVIIGISAVPAGAVSFGAVFAFGDSLNDCCINPAAPFTNGPQTWIPGFAAAIGADYPDPETATRNYAVGGAQSGQSHAFPATDTAQGFQSGLLAQIGRFEASGATVGGHDLALIWAGTNDIWPSGLDGDGLFGLTANKPAGANPTPQALAATIKANIGEAAERLRDSGFGKLLILTPFDVGNSALIDNADGPARNSAYSYALRDQLLGLYTPGLDTWVLDMVALLEEVQAGAPGNGFAFLDGFSPCSAGTILCEDRSQVEQDSYVFLDFVHLTTATNAIVSDRAAALVMTGAPVAPIPLPAAGWLLLAALGAIPALAQRRG